MDNSGVWFVKMAAKYRRAVRGSILRPASVYSFGSEPEARAFANGFSICRVDVWHQGKVVFSNYSTERPKWVSEGEALVIREQNKQTIDDRKKAV